jgi:hypothetical protein
MAIDPLSLVSLLKVGKSAIERIWPDANKRAEEMRKLQELEQKGQLAELEAHVKTLTMQAQINLEDAKSGNMWQAGWRPAIGWVGALSLFLMYVPKAIMMTIIWAWQCFAILNGAEDVSAVNLPAFPDLGVTDIIGLLMSMLGIAGMRSYDKMKKTDTKGVN